MTTIFIHAVEGIDIRRATTYKDGKHDQPTEWLQIEIHTANGESTALHCRLERDWTFQDETTQKETGAEAPVMLKDQAD